MAAPLLTLDAPAKVNLTLEVIRRRPDGYHDICSVMQTLSLADRLTFAPSDTLDLRCTRADLAGPDNLVWRAAELLREESGSRAGAEIVLEKRIPVAAGLGGGSSDAAAALRGLSRLWSLAVSRERLHALAAQLGSDVPFFLIGSGCALAEGRGERLTPLLPLPHRWVVLLKPPLGISTAAVYGAVAREHWSDGSATRVWLEQARNAGPHDALPMPFNALEPVALALEPRAAAARRALLAAAARHAIMSGSGPTYFSLFEDREEAQQVHRRLLAGGHEAYLTRFLLSSA